MGHKGKKRPAKTKRKAERFRKLHGEITRTEWAKQKRLIKKKILQAHIK